QSGQASPSGVPGTPTSPAPREPVGEGVAEETLTRPPWGDEESRCVPFRGVAVAPVRARPQDPTCAGSQAAPTAGVRSPEAHSRSSVLAGNPRAYAESNASARS